MAIVQNENLQKFLFTMSKWISENTFRFQIIIVSDKKRCNLWMKYNFTFFVSVSNLMRFDLVIEKK